MAESTAKKPNVLVRAWKKIRSFFIIVTGELIRRMSWGKMMCFSQKKQQNFCM